MSSDQAKLAFAESAMQRAIDLLRDGQTDAARAQLESAIQQVKEER